jgi:hypothetical protein
MLRMLDRMLRMLCSTLGSLEFAMLGRWSTMWSQQLQDAQDARQYAQDAMLDAGSLEFAMLGRWSLQCFVL